MPKRLQKIISREPSSNSERAQRSESTSEISIIKQLLSNTLTEKTDCLFLSRRDRDAYGQGKEDAKKVDFRRRRIEA